MNGASTPPQLQSITPTQRIIRFCRDGGVIRDEGAPTFKDARDDVARVVTEASLAHLRAAWHAVDDMHQWATTLCDAVETELNELAAKRSSPDYPGLWQWLFGVLFGLNRILLRLALLEPKPATHARAGTAVMLLYLATGICRLRVMEPYSQFELLPHLLPPFLYQLTELVAADPPASLRTPDPT